MSERTVSSESVLVRRMDVMPRRTDSVENVSDCGDGGLLLETLIGRYVLNRDARQVWRLIDGRNSVSQIAVQVAEAMGGVSPNEVTPAVLATCKRFCDLGVAELLDDQ